MVGSEPTTSETDLLTAVNGEQALTTQTAKDGQRMASRKNTRKPQSRVYVQCPLCGEMVLRESMPPAVPWPCAICEGALKRFPANTIKRRYGGPSGFWPMPKGPKA